MTAAAAALLGALVVLAGYAGTAVLALAVLLVQAVLLWAWPRALRLAAPAGVRVVAGAAALAADALVATEVAEAPLEPLAAVLGLALVAALVAQLARRDDRSRVVAALTGTVAAAVLAVGAALHLGVRLSLGGADAVAAGAVGAAAAALGWALPALPAVVRVAVALALGAGGGAVPAGTDGAWLGLVAAAAGVLGAFTASTASGGAPPRVALGATLPLALAAAPTYALARVLLG